MIGFPVCPECGGKGTKQTLSGIVNDMTGRNWPEVRLCPSCVEGVVITDELVEAVALTLYENDHFYWSWESQDEPIKDDVRQEARAVLAAVVRHLKEKEQ